MYNKTLKWVAYFVILALFSVSLTYAKWQPVPNYVYWQNLTVSNWSYNNGYNPSFNPKTKYVLFNLSNISNPNEFLIYGYDSNNNPLGSIFDYFVQNTGTNVILLIPNTTISGQRWAKATIFYDAINFTGPVLLGNLSNSKLPECIPRYCVSSYNGITFFLLTNFTSNPSFSRGPPDNISATINFTLNTSNTGAFVVLSNMSNEDIEVFNESYCPNNNNCYNIFGNSVISLLTESNNYKLETLSLGNLLNSYVSNSAIESQNANFIFNQYSPFDGLGYEGYFSSYPSIFSGTNNVIATEGMYASSIGISNSLATKLVLYYPNLRPQRFLLNVSSAVPETFIILPAFTTNVVISSPIKNNAPIDNTSFYDFIREISITNITWSYNFTTYGSQAPYNGIANKIIVGGNGVPYVLVNVTHYTEMGSYCYNTYFRANVGGVDLGPVPFSIVNCAPNTSTATFILQNITSLDYDYNSVNLLYDSPSNKGGFAGANVFNNWEFANGNNLNIYRDTNAPFTVQLNTPLNLNSNIIFSNGNLCAELSYNSVYILSGLNQFNAYQYVNDPSLTTQFLINQVGGFLLPQFFSKYLTDTYDGVNGHISNITESLTVGHNCNWDFIQFNLLNNYAVLNKLASTQYTVGIPTVVNNTNNNCIVCTTPSPTYIILPNSATGLNYSATTTINFNSGFLGSSIILFGNTTFPRYVFLILALILELIGLVMLGNKKGSEFSYAIMIIGLWVMGIWQIPLLIVAFIVSVVFILYEFIL